MNHQNFPSWQKIIKTVGDVKTDDFVVLNGQNKRPVLVVQSVEEVQVHGVIKTEITCVWFPHK